MTPPHSPLLHSNKKRKLSIDLCVETVTVKQWYDGFSEKQEQEGLPLVDLRSEEEHARKPLIAPLSSNATIVNLPFDELLSGARSCELPPRDLNFAILVPAHVSRDDIDQFFFATQSTATLQSRKPWLVRQMIFESNDFWDDAKAVGLHPNSDEPSGHYQFPLPRLWKPDSMVEQILKPLLVNKFVTGDGEFVVWDLGSGAGRDVSFLAEELKKANIEEKVSRPLKVVGFDNHKGSAKRALPLWKNRMVDDVTNCQLINLKNLNVVEKAIEDESGLLCLYSVRFLNRRLIEWLACKARLRTGCIFAISHFCKEDGTAWTWDHPKEHSVLSRHELHDLFSSGSDWKILHDNICLDGDHGRPMVHFCAEKRCL